MPIPLNCSGTSNPKIDAVPSGFAKTSIVPPVFESTYLILWEPAPNRVDASFLNISNLTPVVYLIA